MTAPALVQKLWNYCNILRDDGLSYGDLPAPGIIAADIVADLEAALEQFSALEEDLKE